MIPSLFYLCLCVLSGYAIARLGPVMDRMEDAQRERILAAIQGAPAPSWWVCFLTDLLTALGLCGLFLTCLILACAFDPR